MPASTDTAASANAALGAHFFAEQDRLRGGPEGSLCATSYQAVLGGNPPMDRAGHEQFAVGFYAAFPDLRHDVEEVFATDDRAVVRLTIRGTHTGNFFGIPASGGPIRVVTTAILDVHEGQVTRVRAVFDEAGLLRQIGVLPT